MIPGVYVVGDYPKSWGNYVWRLSGIKDANSESSCRRRHCQ